MTNTGKIEQDKPPIDMRLYNRLNLIETLSLARENSTKIVINLSLEIF